MLNAVYRLVAPRRFETEFCDINLFTDRILVRPTHMSICRADQRYYQGLRPEEILEKKLPMALIHEAIGEVIYDPLGEYRIGDSVVMIPNTPVEKDEVVAENYLRSSRFRASSLDGFMQDTVSLERDRVLKLPEKIDKKVAAFTELASVSVHAILRMSRFANMKRECVGIWGDGNLGYITAIFFKAMFPEIRLYVFGINAEKLSYFTFADEVFLTQKVPKGIGVDQVFECVGGSASQRAIEQMIALIRPEGSIALLGVSEYAIPINTRMVLEKGLHIFGNSRSGRADFEKTVEIYEKNPEVIEYLRNIVGAQIEIYSIDDMIRAFELDQQKAIGKTIMIWKK